MSELKDKVAIVTGGSRGIGRAIVLKLAGLGCHVAFNYHEQKQAADALVKEVTKFKVRCKASKVDVRDLNQVKA
ncbi:MAG: SDR family NAD(P)-dependent oxidoreductase, partial [Candidatus Omnitrophota bacterium]|nr:SDR family NAD(P)-dependent oxidoreductase [Candidatus Omnitrophota bacterium]